MKILFLDELALGEEFIESDFGGSGLSSSGLMGNSGLLSLIPKETITKFILIFVLVTLLMFGLYIYLSIVYSKIARKAKLNSPGIAWMPSLGKLAVIFEASKMHWWPFLMLIGGLLFGYLLMIINIAISSTAITVLSFIILIPTSIIFAVMTIIWHWKTYEAIGKPGWWILVPVASGALGYLLMIIAAIKANIVVVIIGLIIAVLGMIAHLVLIGIAAWSSEIVNNPELIKGMQQ